MDPVGVAAAQPGGNLAREPRLARAARPGQGQQARAPERLRDLGDLASATDEGRLLQGQTAHAARRRHARCPGASGRIATAGPVVMAVVATVRDSGSAIELAVADSV